MAATWFHMTAAELGREIGAGRINPVDLTEAFLDQAAAHPQAERIYARLTETRARGEAMGAASRAGKGFRKGLLDGVPVSWKDNVDTAGVATEAGSALLAGRVPQADAEVLVEATLQGLVCLGKTHMSELAFSGLGLNPVTATPPCLNDERAVPGGSSSGAAASVAFGLAPAAVGTDTGGSIRLPAAWNDLVGFKPGHGTISGTGIVPLCESFDTAGPLAHSVEDCALLHAALLGRAAVDLEGASLAGLRLAVLEGMAQDGVRERPARGFSDAVERLARAGARIEKLEAPEPEEANSFSAALFSGEGWGIWREVIEAAPEKMFAPIRERFELGGKVTAADFVAHWRRLRVLRASFAARAEGFDAVILPTSPILPPDAERLMTDNAYYVTENLLALRNTRIGNTLGQAALSLPTSEPSCGISFMVPGGEEGRLLRLAAAAERALR